MRLSMRGVQVLRGGSHSACRFLSTAGGNKGENFGYQRVGIGEKEEKVRGVFASVASNYDVMNDLMSAGTFEVLLHIFTSESNMLDRF